MKSESLRSPSLMMMVCFGKAFTVPCSASAFSCWGGIRQNAEPSSVDPAIRVPPHIYRETSLRLLPRVDKAGRSHPKPHSAQLAGILHMTAAANARDQRGTAALI